MRKKFEFANDAAGLDVTNAQITTVNGQRVISAQMLAPAPLPGSLIPITQQSSWKNKAVLWGENAQHGTNIDSFTR